MREYRDAALVLIGHGSTVNPASSAPTLEHARTLREREIFAEVAAGFWMEKPSMRDALRGVESKEIYVVPNFISEGYFTRTVIPRELELDGALTRRDGRTIKYCEPVGSHPRVTDAILQRVREAAPDVSPADTTLFIVGHGTPLNKNSGRAAKDQARKIQALGLFGEVLAAFMEEHPPISDWNTLSAHSTVIVVPFFISDGLHGDQDIPVLLGIAGETPPAPGTEKLLGKNPYHLRGKALYYAKAIGTDPMMADIILDQVRHFDDSLARPPVHS